MSEDWGRSESEFKLIECISALLGEIPGEAFARKPVSGTVMAEYLSTNLQ